MYRWTDSRTSLFNIIGGGSLLDLLDNNRYLHLLVLKDSIFNLPVIVENNYGTRPVMAVALLVSRSQTLAQGEGLREGLAPRD